MANTDRPLRDTVSSLLNAWDGPTDDNFVRLFDDAIPLPELSDVSDEGDVNTLFPATDYGNCLVVLKHSVLLQWLRYETVGNSEWRSREQNFRCPTTLITGTTATLSGKDTIVLASNAAAQAITLPSVSAEAGRKITIKQNGAGAVTVHRGGSSTIDGATTYAIPAQFGAVTVYSDGTNWHIVSKA